MVPIIAVFVISVLLIAAMNYRLLSLTVNTKTDSKLDIFTESILAQIKHLEVILEATRQTLDENHIAVARSLAHVLDNGSADMTPEELQRLVESLGILTIHIADSNGIVINSGTLDSIGFDYGSSEATRIYMALADGTLTELSEEPRRTVLQDGTSGNIHHYTGVARAGGRGFIQVGFDASVLGRLQDEINITRTVKNTKLENNGYGIVLANGLISAHPNDDMLGLDVSGEDWYRTISRGDGYAWIDVDGGRYYAGYKNADGNTVVGLVPKNEFYRELNQVLTETLLFLLIAIGIMIFVTYMLLDRLLLPIRRLSEGLGEIAMGDLDARIEGDYNNEFDEIKDAVNSMAVGIKTYLNDKLNAEHAAHESEISVMLGQIRPHFLYNSLTAIQELCLIDPETASETVSEFSNYLRVNMDSLTIKKPIPFENELRHLETYLSLEKKRFGEKLNIVYDISTRDFYLPVLTLQPLVENAVRHGVTKREEGGTVIIKTEESDGDVTITVCDDGVGFEQGGGYGRDDRAHVGIENVRNRLAVLCGGTLSIQSEPGVGTTVAITIPREILDREYSVTQSLGFSETPQYRPQLNGELRRLNMELEVL